MRHWGKLQDIMQDTQSNYADKLDDKNAIIDKLRADLTRERAQNLEDPPSLEDIEELEKKQKRSDDKIDKILERHARTPFVVEPGDLPFATGRIVVTSHPQGQFQQQLLHGLQNNSCNSVALGREVRQINEAWNCQFCALASDRSYKLLGLDQR